MSLARFGVTRPVPVNLLMATAIIAGVVAAFTIRREFFPETTPEQAMVTLPYPGATPEEIEESMAQKVEDALAELDEVDRMVTTISEGGGSILVEFRSGVNIDKAVDEVERAVDLLTDLPEDAEEIRVTEFEPTLPVIMVTLFGGEEPLSASQEEAMKRAIRAVRDDLKRLPGMGDIVFSGVRDYEVRVEVSPAAMLKHGISLPQVADAIGAWMRDVPGGSVRTQTGTINVRTLGVPEQAGAIRDIVVQATAEGQALRVADIASVREDFVDEQIARRFNGQPAVSLTVFKTGDQDAVEIAEMVRAYVVGRRGEAFDAGIADRLNAVITTLRRIVGFSSPAIRSQRLIAYEMGLNQSQPVPGQLATHSDLARFIEGRLSLLSRNAFQGAVLVFLTLLLFLNWRAAFWVMAGLVTALCGTMVMMSIFGITLNLLTMFGLIIVVGMLVDDAIVVAENIQSRHDRGETSLQAAIRGGEQVFWPVVATVTTTVVAFLPLMFIRGRIGDLLGALPIVVAVALFASLIESTLILPSHMAHSLVKRDKRKPGRFVGVLRRYELWRDRVINDIVIPGYERMLRVLLEYRWITAAATVAVLIVSLGMFAGGRLEFVFLDDSDAETLVVDVRMPIGTSIEETGRIVERIEGAATAQSEVKSVSTVVGQQVDVNTNIAEGNATHFAQVFIELLPVEQRERESAKVIATMREAHGMLPGVEQLRYSEIGGAGGGADITLQVIGEDAVIVNAGVAEVKAVLAQRAGVHDIADDNYNNQRELQIRLKPGAAALGFSVADVSRQIRGALFGIDAHVFSAQREDIDVRVRLEEAARRELRTIDDMWVISPGGVAVPLNEIAQLVEGTNFSTIRRIDRERAVTVTADTAPDISPETIMTDIQPELDAIAGRGVTITAAGRQRDLQKALSSLPIGLGAAVLLIYVILAWLFSSYLQPIIVMLAIPFGLIGVVWGHLLFGYKATFLSLIGLIALCGIVVNNSLIVVEFFNVERRRRQEERLLRHGGVQASAGDASSQSILRESLVVAGKQRLRPIVLTSMTTFLGLTPLMLEQSFQARFLIPMAISISFGLLSSTILVLTMLPCFMVILDDLKAAVHFLWHGRPRSDVVDASSNDPELIAADSG